MRILSAEYRKYNANSRDDYVGDCVRRAISLAFGMDYNQVNKDLLRLGGRDSTKIYVWDNYVMSLGDVTKHRELSILHPEESDMISLSDWADEHSSGTWLVVTGGSKNACYQPSGLRYRWNYI